MIATKGQSNLAHLLNESHLVCVEIGLAEIEEAAGLEACLIHTSDITEITNKALLKRPQHATEILLVSSWLFADALCTQTQRDVVRNHFLTAAQSIEATLS